MNNTDKVFYVISWLLIAGFLVVVLLQATRTLTLTDIPVPCAFRFATGLYCPGCGGTHAVTELAGGHIIESFLAHPFVLYVGVCAVTDALWNTVALVRGRGFLHFRMLYLYIGLAVLFIQWVVKNALLLAG